MFVGKARIVSKSRAPERCIHNASFSSKLTHGPNKLECYITLGWKGFTGYIVSYDENEVL